VDPGQTKREGTGNERTLDQGGQGPKPNPEWHALQPKLEGPKGGGATGGSCFQESLPRKEKLKGVARPDV